MIQSANAVSVFRVAAFAPIAALFVASAATVEAGNPLSKFSDAILRPAAMTNKALRTHARMHSENLEVGDQVLLMPEPQRPPRPTFLRQQLDELRAAAKNHQDADSILKAMGYTRVQIPDDEKRSINKRLAGEGEPSLDDFALNFVGDKPGLDDLQKYLPLSPAQKLEVAEWEKAVAKYDTEKAKYDEAITAYRSRVEKEEQDRIGHAVAFSALGIAAYFGLLWALTSTARALLKATRSIFGQKSPSFSTATPEG